MVRWDVSWEGAGSGELLTLGQPARTKANISVIVNIPPINFLFAIFCSFALATKSLLCVFYAQRLLLSRSIQSSPQRRTYPANWLVNSGPEQFPVPGLCPDSADIPPRRLVTGAGDIRALRAVQVVRIELCADAAQHFVYIIDDCQCGPFGGIMEYLEQYQYKENTIHGNPDEQRAGLG
jgi:hypothetical protein